MGSALGFARQLGPLGRSSASAARPPIFDTLGTYPMAKDHDKLYFTIIRGISGPTDWRLWYNALGGTIDTPFLGMGYATSTDGLIWTKPNLGQVTFGGDTNNNFQTPGTYPADSVQGGYVWYDANALAGQKFIQLLSLEGVNGGLWLLGSDDGITWSDLAVIYSIQNPFRAGSAIAKRPNGIGVAFAVEGQGSNNRSIAYFTSDSTDLSGTWTQQGICTGLLADGTGFNQFYGLGPIIPVGSTWYAPISRYNSATQVNTIELWSSADYGVSFTQTRVPWIKRGKPGAWNSNNFFASCPVQLANGTWRPYYQAGNEPHSAFFYNSQIGIANVPFP